MFTQAHSYLLLVIILILNVNAFGSEHQNHTNNHDLRLSFSEVVKNTAPSVVNIYTRKKVTLNRELSLFNDPFFKRFFGDGFNGYFRKNELPKQNSLGSGVIVSADGVIVTNQHVIEGADQIRIVLHNRREFEANLIATDIKTDLSFLKINSKKKLPYLRLSNSDTLEVGDVVLAIGNPFGVGQTVTSGIISALFRTRVGLSKFSAFIQTDAAINPGNSGGALVTLDGELAGINTAIFSKSGGSHGIGFAIPSNMVGAVIRGITDTGELIRGWLGATGQPINQDIANSLGLDRPMGILINTIHKDGSASKAGIKIGDVILKVNNYEIFDPNGLAHRIATLPVGKVINILLIRSGKQIAKSVLLESAPEIPKRNQIILTGNHPLSGAKIANISPFLAEKLNQNPYMNGVIILKVNQRSSAYRLGFRELDRIIDINSYKIKNIKSVKKALSDKKNQWKIKISRGGKSLSLLLNR